MLLRLRNARNLARLVLVWFALAMGAAIASPLVKPQSLALVCSGSGILKVLDAGDGPDTGAPLDHAGKASCVLCISAGAPPPALAVQPAGLMPSISRVQPAPGPAMAVSSAAPQPARGPPPHA